MSDTKLKKEDADNFYCHLLEKINSCSDENNHIGCKRNENHNSKECNCEINGGSECSFKVKSEENCDGKKIKKYLDNVVPRWEDMKSTRLYKHIQKMHENAEEIRRFEIDLIWRRALYFVPLIVIFFTAFGGAFFSFQSEFGINSSNKFINTNITINQEDKIFNGKAKGYIASDYNDKKNKTENESIYSPAYEDKSIKGHWILLGIAFVNACLCFLLTKMNVESQRWQNNWECHIDYLQQILGFKLMQTCLRPKGGYFSIRKTNAFIGFIAFLVWYFALLFLLASLLDININFEFKYCNFLCDAFSLSVHNYVSLGVLVLCLFIVFVVLLAPLITILAAPLITSLIVSPIVVVIVVVILTLLAFPIPELILGQILIPILAPILALSAIYIFVKDIYFCLTGEPIFKESNINKKVQVSKYNKFYIRELEIFVLEYDPLEEWKDGNYFRYKMHTIILSLPFIFVFILCILDQFFKMELSFNLIMLLLIFIPIISNFFRCEIENASTDSSQG